MSYFVDYTLDSFHSCFGSSFRFSISYFSICMDILSRGMQRNAIPNLTLPVLLAENIFNEKKYIYFLISALAINCYTCIPQPPSNWCISNLNVSNCDNVPGAPPGATFDTCAKVSLEISFGGQKFSANSMTCGIKVSLRRGYIQNVYM